MSIPQITLGSLPLQGAKNLGSATREAGAGGGFGGTLSRALESLNDGISDAYKGAENVASGGGDVQSAVLGMVEAELNLRIALGVRDRLVEAYRSMERMAL